MWLVAGVMLFLAVFGFIIMPWAFRRDREALRQKRLAIARTDEVSEIAAFIRNGLAVLDLTRAATQGDLNTVDNKARLYTLTRSIANVRANLSVLTSPHPPHRLIYEMDHLLYQVLGHPKDYLDGRPAADPKVNRVDTLNKVNALVEVSGFVNHQSVGLEKHT